MSPRLSAQSSSFWLGGRGRASARVLYLRSALRAGAERPALLAVYALQTFPIVPRYDQLVLPFGLGIAAVTLLYWTLWEFDRYGTWLGEGVVRSAVALGAVGILALVLRLARVADEHFADRRRPDES